MFIIKKTNHFDRWFTKLKDVMAKARIVVLFKKIEKGNLGDHKLIGDGISKFRIDYGPGYRLYYKKKGSVIILLLNDGVKKTQERDIAKAKEIWKEIEVNDENKSK